jgi:hypothetical protein
MTTASQIIALTFPLITAGILGIAGVAIRRIYGKRSGTDFTVQAAAPAFSEKAPSDRSPDMVDRDLEEALDRIKRAVAKDETELARHEPRVVELGRSPVGDPRWVKLYQDLQEAVVLAGSINSEAERKVRESMVGPSKE